MITAAFIGRAVQYLPQLYGIEVIGLQPEPIRQDDGLILVPAYRIVPMKTVRKSLHWYD